jgi:hypothetical protein
MPTVRGRTEIEGGNCVSTKIDYIRGKFIYLTFDNYIPYKLSIYEVFRLNKRIIVFVTTISRIRLRGSRKEIGRIHIGCQKKWRAV